jgi:hypothetical protein
LYLIQAWKQKIAIVDIAWIIQLLWDLLVTLSAPPKILCHDQSAILMALN